MMQAFRNSAKVAGAIFALLMLIFVLTSVDWQGLDKEISTLLARLTALTPPGHETMVHVSLTDEPPMAQAFVIIEATPLS